MKLKIATLLISFLFLFSASSHAVNWVLINSGDKATVYVDKDSIKKVGSYISASQKIILPALKTEIVNSTLYNCRQRESSIQSMLVFRPDGVVDELTKPEKTWAYLPKGDGGNASSLDYVCSK
jgi:hypothetical protein